MKQILYYYYNINFKIISENAEFYILEYNNNQFIFKRLVIDNEALKNNINILNNYNILFHKVLLNNKNDIVSTYKGNDYVLLKIDETIKDRWFGFEQFEVGYGLVEFGDIWAKRLEYYTSILQEKNVNNILFLSIFNYYVGMSENAISISNRLKNNNANLRKVLAHKRVDYPFNYMKYFDPTEMLIDFKIRDYSEYLKSKIFKEDIIIDKEIKYLMSTNYTNDEINALIARLLYPSFYFDLLDQWIDGKIASDEILKLTEFIKKYETFLNEFFTRLSIMYNVYIIDWIKK